MDAKASQVSCALILPPLFPPALAYPACVPARRSDSAPLRRGRRKPTISAHRWCSWRGWRATKVGPSVTRAQYPPTHSAKIAALDRVRSSAALLVGPENCQGGDPDARGHRPAREHRNAPVRAKKNRKNEQTNQSYHNFSALKAKAEATYPDEYRQATQKYTFDDDEY